MSSVAFLAGPAFVLLASYAFLKAYEEKEARLVRIGVGCLLAAVVILALGIAADRPDPAPAPPTHTAVA